MHYHFFNNNVRNFIALYNYIVRFMLISLNFDSSNIQKSINPK